jgi:hypothetical protein
LEKYTIIYFFGGLLIVVGNNEVRDCPKILSWIFSNTKKVSRKQNLTEYGKKIISKYFVNFGRSPNQLGFLL